MTNALPPGLTDCLLWSEELGMASTRVLRWTIAGRISKYQLLTLPRWALR